MNDIDKDAYIAKLEDFVLATLLRYSQRESQAAIAKSEAQTAAEFSEWWDTVGSAITPDPQDDMETHARRVAESAWYYCSYPLLPVSVPFVPTSGRDDFSRWANSRPDPMEQISRGPAMREILNRAKEDADQHEG